MAAAILHDVLEDTATELAELAERFGSELAALVAALTEDAGIKQYERRKAALRDQVAGLNADVVAVYAADKVAKVRELRAHAARDPGILHGDTADRGRMDHYVDSLAMLETDHSDHPLVRQLRFELEALRALPPRGVRRDDIPPTAD